MVYYIVQLEKRQASHIVFPREMQEELRSPLLNVYYFELESIPPDLQLEAYWKWAIKMKGQAESQIPKSVDQVEITHVRFPFHKKTEEFDSDNISDIKSIAILEMIGFINQSRAEPRLWWELNTGK